MTTIKVEAKTHERLKALGAKDETFDQIITRLLTESEWLPRLESAYAEADQLSEESKKAGKHSLATQATDTLLSVLKPYIEHVKERSR